MVSELGLVVLSLNERQALLISICKNKYETLPRVSHVKVHRVPEVTTVGSGIHRWVLHIQVEGNRQR